MRHNFITKVKSEILPLILRMLNLIGKCYYLDTSKLQPATSTNNIGDVFEHVSRRSSVFEHVERRVGDHVLPQQQQQQQQRQRQQLGQPLDFLGLVRYKQYFSDFE